MVAADQISIRRCTVEDAFDATEVLYNNKDYLRKLNYRTDMPLRNVFATVSNLMANPRNIVVAGEVDGAVIGYAWAAPVLEDMTGLVHFIVKPEYKGTGRSFGLAACRWAFEEGGLSRLIVEWPLELKDSDIREFTRRADGNVLSLNTQLKMGFEYAGTIPLVMTREAMAAIGAGEE